MNAPHYGLFPRGTAAQQSPSLVFADDHMSDQERSKRQKPNPTKLVSKEDRKKVSRACDLCKAKKVRCSGTQPCNRCAANKALRCRYNAEHKRGRPPSPEPLNGSVIDGEEVSPSSHSLQAQEVVLNTPTSLSPVLPLPTVERQLSSRSSQEPEETGFDGHYIGPTSGISFLYRAQRRFKHDFRKSNSMNIENKGTVQPSVLKFGDAHQPEPSPLEHILPQKSEGTQLLDRYFDFAMPTYRFLDRTAAEIWFENMIHENDSGTQQRQEISSAKSAIVLLILATSILYAEDSHDVPRVGGSVDFAKSERFFLAAEQKIGFETGPVRLESIQARLAQCIYLLGSSRINQAWYTFGTTCQMIIALGLHRKRHSQAFDSLSDPIELRKRVFWSAYTLDRYLSVILGRPRTFRDEDIDQVFPEKQNDEDSGRKKEKSKSILALCVSDGPVMHARLAKIIGGISSDLYPTNKSRGGDWKQLTEHWTAELKDWKESLPPFLEPEKVDPSMLIPIFQRQSTVLRLAYAHALILANRQSLLTNFADLSRPETLLPEELQDSIKECIDAAMLVVDIVNEFIEQGKMRRAFWFTHYVSFCAIATLYIYTIQQDIHSGHQRTPDLPVGLASKLKHFDAAERCQKNILATTVSTSPFRKYNIILDELKRETLLRLGYANQLATSLTVPQEDGPALSGLRPTNDLLNQTGHSHHDFLDSSTFDRQEIPILQQQSLLPDDPSSNSRLTFETREAMVDGVGFDQRFFGQEGDLLGWSEFDACALNWPDALDWST